MNLKEKLNAAKEEQLLSYAAYHEQMFNSLKPFENTVFVNVTHTEDFYEPSQKKTELIITVLGDSKDHEFFRADKIKEPNHTERQIEEKYAIHFFQSNLTLLLTKTETQENFVKAIKYSKPNFVFDYTVRNADRIIRDFTANRNSTLVAFPLSDFESFADIHANILNKISIIPDNEQLLNWRIIGTTQAADFSTPQDFVQKEVLIHNSLIKQINTFMTDNLNKHHFNEHLNYFNSKMFHGFLDKDLSNENITRPKLKI